MEGIAEPFDVQNAVLEGQLDRLEQLSEDELLTLIGAEAVTPLEVITATVSAYASAEVFSALERQQLVGGQSVNLALRGRRRVQRVLEDWGDQLRETICPLWMKNANLRDLALGIAAVLANLLSVVTMVLVGISLCIARYFLEELCGSRAPAPAEIPASA